jgi:hypothetical protein
MIHTTFIKRKLTPSLVELHIACSLDLVLSPAFWSICPTLGLDLPDTSSLGPLLSSVYNGYFL